MKEITKAEPQMNGANILTDEHFYTEEKGLRRISNALNNVLSDNKFLASPKMSAFLSYVVHETIAGNSNRIKAYSVAVDALGKPTSFDPQHDPSVRVLANRLRASLKNYYAANPTQALYIELYRGSYVPHFIDHSGCEYVYCDKGIKMNASSSPNFSNTSGQLTSLRSMAIYPVLRSVS